MMVLNAKPKQNDAAIITITNVVFFICQIYNFLKARVVNLRERGLTFFTHHITQLPNKPLLAIAAKLRFFSLFVVKFLIYFIYNFVEGAANSNSFFVREIYLYVPLLKQNQPSCKVII